MSDQDDGCCAEVSTLIFACSGSSNVGQLTNSLALRLSREGFGKMSCLAGVAAHLRGFVAAAKDCKRLVVLDGCKVCCALKTFEHVDVKPHIHVNLVEHGFQKKHGAPANETELDRAHALVTDRLKETSSGS